MIYAAYIKPSHDKIGIVETGSNDATTTWAAYTGDAKLYFAKYDSLSLDSSEPAFNENYHWALIWGTLYLLGFRQFKKLFDDEVSSAISTRDAKPFHQVKIWYY